MNIGNLQKRALEIREKYKLLEIKKFGSQWSNEQLIKGFINDVNELIKLVQTKDDKEKISHELSDCLWSVLVLANNLNIDIESSFLENMDQLETRIDQECRNHKA